MVPTHSWCEVQAIQDQRYTIHDDSWVDGMIPPDRRHCSVLGSPNDFFDLMKKFETVKSKRIFAATHMDETN